MKEVLTSNGIAVRSFNADLLYEPWEVLDDEGRPFNTFTEFWDRCLSMPYDPESPQLPPKKIISGHFAYESYQVSIFRKHHLYLLKQIQGRHTSYPHTSPSRGIYQVCFVWFRFVP